jgi:uncharacterized membrane protein YwaF
MLWGSFGPVHIATLVLAVAIIVSLYYILKNKSAKVQVAVLGVFSFMGILAVGYDMVMWKSPLEYLPLHLCSINALVLPFAVFTRSKTLTNLLLVWGLGAVAALVMNSGQANYEIFGWTFFFYYFPHVFECGIPILMFKLGLTKKDPKCILPTLGITMGAYTVIHLINLVLNEYIAANQILDWAGNLIQVNYMYSLKPVVPLMELFWQVIPYSYWYMYVAVPIIFAYLLIIYAPEFWAIYKEKKAAKAKV